MGLAGICHKLFSRRSQCCGWTSPSDSYYDCRMHLSNNYQEILKNKFYYSQVLEGTHYAQGHTAKSNRKTERKQQHGVLPLLGSWACGGADPRGAHPRGMALLCPWASHLPSLSPGPIDQRRFGPPQQLYCQMGWSSEALFKQR